MMWIFSPKKFTGFEIVVELYLLVGCDWQLKTGAVRLSGGLLCVVFVTDLRSSWHWMLRQ
jgi:hypothetical protein